MCHCWPGQSLKASFSLRLWSYQVWKINHFSTTASINISNYTGTVLQKCCSADISWLTTCEPINEKKPSHEMHEKKNPRYPLLTLIPTTRRLHPRGKNKQNQPEQIIQGIAQKKHVRRQHCGKHAATVHTHTGKTFRVGEISSYQKIRRLMGRGEKRTALAQIAAMPRGKSFSLSLVQL